MSGPPDTDLTDAEWRASGHVYTPHGWVRVEHMTKDEAVAALNARIDFLEHRTEHLEAVIVGCNETQRVLTKQRDAAEAQRDKLARFIEEVHETCRVIAEGRGMAFGGERAAPTCLYKDGHGVFCARPARAGSVHGWCPEHLEAEGLDGEVEPEGRP